MGSIATMLFRREQANIKDTWHVIGLRGHLEQARADLGIVTTRANTGGAHAVQWSLPG